MLNVMQGNDNYTLQNDEFPARSRNKAPGTKMLSWSRKAHFEISAVSEGAGELT